MLVPCTTDYEIFAKLMVKLMAELLVPCTNLKAIRGKAPLPCRSSQKSQNTQSREGRYLQAYD